MRKGAIEFGLITILGGMFGVCAQPPVADGGDSVQSIEISAKKYEFTPSEIHVKAGTRVEIKVHSLDETHGIKLKLDPEGSATRLNPGLEFDRPEDNGKVKKNQDQILDFVAKEPGTYDFECAKVCGIHHGRMKGKLVVEE